MSVNDQPGKDPEIGQESMDLRKLYDDVLPLGNVLITVTDKDLVDHHVVVPIPKSYEAATAIAFDQLGEHIPTNGGSLHGNGYLTYGVKSATGEVVWAKLPPEFWKEVVKDGDQLQFFCKPAPLELGTRFAVFLKWSATDKTFTGENSLTIPLPKSYEDAQDFILSTGYRQNPNQRIAFYMQRGRGGTPFIEGKERFWYVVLGANWMRWTSEVQGNVEIGIREC